MLMAILILDLFSSKCWILIYMITHHWPARSSIWKLNSRKIGSFHNPSLWLCSFWLWLNQIQWSFWHEINYDANSFKIYFPYYCNPTDILTAEPYSTILRSNFTLLNLLQDECVYNCSFIYLLEFYSLP